MANQISLDDINYQSDVCGGLDDLNVSYTQNGTQSVAATFSGSITFSGAAAQYIIDTFFEDKLEGMNKTIQAMVHLDCCDIDIPYQMTAKNVQRCGCTVIATLTTVDESQRCYDVLNKTQLMDVAGEIEWCRMKYCEGSSFVDILIAILIVVLAPILVILRILNEIVVGLCKN